MMWWKFLVCGGFASACIASDIGYVDFAGVVETSKVAKQQEQGLHKLRKELEERVSQLDKELQEMATKLQDPDYIDSLSQDAENEQRMRLQAMGEERMRLVQQVTMQFQQAQQRFLQEMTEQVGRASAEVARARSLDAILNREVLFYVSEALDCTSAVISVMDRTPSADSGS